MFRKNIIVFIVVILLTGCTNSLNCRIKTDNYNAKIEIIFKDDKPYKYLFKDKMFFYDKPLDKYFYYKRKTKDYDSLIAFKSARVLNKRNKVISFVNYNFLRENNYTKDKLFINKHDNIKSSIKKIEDLGYTCK